MYSVQQALLGKDLAWSLENDTLSHVIYVKVVVNLRKDALVTASKAYQYGVFSGPYLDTFHAVNFPINS